METIYTKRLLIEPVKAAHGPEFLNLYVANRSYLQPWEPKREDDFYTLDMHTKLCSTAEEALNKGTAYTFAVRLYPTHELIGRVSLSNVVRGVFQNAYLGYFMAEKYKGLGYMTEAVDTVVNMAFKQLLLHRVQAAVVTTNAGSVRVLEKCGFRREGMAERYLKINGAWRNHYLYALTSEEKQV
ncbi:GNAT family N-acetyltransferase [Pontibacter anaerobius]|uniref:GNAT family protein n=1 Tax=Pontibacter anaerobius TaxID=2993940 RepID=A0ABT3RAQ0_9BACT|nr:GNAT family protein [Pontibacter anaerobius]MCX2738385.1 GNAT family protein [Pontibacter anaerobius]